MFSDIFIRRPVLASVCSFIILLVGAVSLTLLPVDYYPEVSPPTVSVESNYSGASAEVVESGVTNILEQAINGVEGMRYVSSTSSSDGTSRVLVTFQQGANLDAAAIRVQRRIELVENQLPEQVLQTGITVAKAGNSAFVQFVNLSSPGGGIRSPLHQQLHGFVHSGCVATHSGHQRRAHFWRTSLRHAYLARPSQAGESKADSRRCG